MLRYIVITIIKTLMLVLAFVIIFATPLKSKTIFASYEISWNALILGNLYWEFILNSKNYEFLITLESAGVSSKIYPFYGQYYSKGEIINETFNSKKYFSVWKAKKKQKTIDIVFENKKVKNLIFSKKQDINPYVDFYNLKDPIDPISASLDLIINNDSKTIKNVFDGRRVYDLSVVKTKLKSIKNNENILNQRNYKLNIENYKNVWKDHNKTNLKEVEITTGEMTNGILLPVDFKIKNKGLVLKIKYIDHSVLP